MFTKALLDIHCNTLIDSMVVLLQEYQHYLTINLTTLRIWCYRCESEVFPSRNTPTFMYVYFTITHTTMLFTRDKKLNVCSSSEPWFNFLSASQKTLPVFRLKRTVICWRMEWVHYLAVDHGAESWAQTVLHIVVFQLVKNQTLRVKTKTWSLEVNTFKPPFLDGNSMVKWPSWLFVSFYLFMNEKKMNFNMTKKQ